LAITQLIIVFVVVVVFSNIQWGAGLTAVEACHKLARMHLTTLSTASLYTVSTHAYFLSASI